MVVMSRDIRPIHSVGGWSSAARVCEKCGRPVPAMERYASVTFIEKFPEKTPEHPHGFTSVGRFVVWHLKCAPEKQEAIRLATRRQPRAVRQLVTPSQWGSQGDSAHTPKRGNDA